MAESYDYDLDPVSFITVGTEGPPGQRTFYLQAAHGPRVVSLVIEKEQALALAASIDRLMVRLLQRDPARAGNLAPVTANLDLLQPVQPAFRVSEMGIGVDEERHMILLVAHEVPEEDPAEGQRARFVASYEQMLALARRALEVVQQGRPICPLCGRPIDPDGHFCARLNGHDTAKTD